MRTQELMMVGLMPEMSGDGLYLVIGFGELLMVAGAIAYVWLLERRR